MTRFVAFSKNQTELWAGCKYHGGWKGLGSQAWGFVLEHCGDVPCSTGGAGAEQAVRGLAGASLPPSAGGGNR